MSNADPKIHIALSSERSIAAHTLRALYDSEPWWPERSTKDLEYILREHLAVGAWHDSKLVGFTRAVSDGRFRAYIEDVLVLAEYRNRGVGKQLMQTLLAVLSNIHVVTLFCQSKLSDYYVDLGFKEFTRQVVMHRRNVR